MGGLDGWVPAYPGMLGQACVIFDDRLWVFAVDGGPAVPDLRCLDEKQSGTMGSTPEVLGPDTHAIV